MTHEEFVRRVDAIMDRVDEMPGAECMRKAHALRAAAYSLKGVPEAGRKKVLVVSDKLEEVGLSKMSRGL